MSFPFSYGQAGAWYGMSRSDRVAIGSSALHRDSSFDVVGDADLPCDEFAGNVANFVEVEPGRVVGSVGGVVAAGAAGTHGGSALRGCVPFVLAGLASPEALLVAVWGDLVGIPPVCFCCDGGAVNCEASDSRDGYST